MFEINELNSFTTEFVFQELLGTGSYGQIYKAVSKKDGQTYAIKILPTEPNDKAFNKITNEIQLMMSCQHENIVKCYGVRLINQCVWIIMQFCSEGSLSNVIRKLDRPFSQEQISTIIRSTLKALIFLHSRQIIHRDIKADNLLLSKDGTVKISDFGVSAIISSTLLGKNTVAGSPYWMSPQLISKSLYTFKTDIWSLGITAIQLAQGQPPYSNMHPFRAMFIIRSNPPKGLTNKQMFSAQFNDFITLCLSINDEQRPTAQMLLKHPFIKNPKFIIPKKMKYQDHIPHTKIKCKQLAKNTLRNSTGTLEIHSQMNIQTIQATQRKIDFKAKPEMKMKTNQTTEQLDKIYEDMEQQLRSVRQKYFGLIKNIVINHQGND